jgi:hypothetical protein
MTIHYRLAGHIGIAVCGAYRPSFLHFDIDAVTCRDCIEHLQAEATDVD